MLHSCAPFTKTLVLPQRSTHSNKNYIGLTLKEYFNINHTQNQLANIAQQNQSEAEADAETPSFPNARHSKQRPHRIRHKTDLEEVLKEEIQHRPSHRMVTLSLEQLMANEKPQVKLPSIHHDMKSKQGRKAGRQVQKRVQESGSVQLAAFLRKDQGKKSLGKQVVGNGRRGVRSRVTSTSFYHMHTRQRIKTEDETQQALEKSFVITRYGALQRTSKPKEETILKRYENSIRMSNKH